MWDGAATPPRQKNAYWSNYYATHERTPENTTELAPYVARAYKRTPDNPRGEAKRECPSCGGTGSYKGRGRCFKCEDTGFVA